MRIDTVWRVPALLTAVALAGVACQKDRSVGPSHRSHAMVGTYHVEATYTSLRSPGGGTTGVSASLSGALTVADTVINDGSSESYHFPDVRMTATFCSAPGTCEAVQSWTGFTTLFSASTPVAFGFGNYFRFEGPFANDGFSGSAAHWVAGDSRHSYEGSFTAVRQ